MPGLTETASNPDRASASGSAYLIRALRGESPFELPSRHQLRETDEVQIGRGDELAHERDGAKLELEVVDAWMSSEHVRIRMVEGRWRLEDLGSKNGTFLNGVRVDKTVIADGDVLEIGHTWFLFRIGPPSDGGLDVRADALAAPHANLRTLSPSLATEFARIAGAASGVLPVLILGETGTGKELIARAIHALSKRSGELVPVNCAALPDALLESELFGYKKGAFSGANEDRQGLVRAADKGTLFLDEVAELAPRAQAALLRTLQEREVRSVGATVTTPVDLRVVSATHRNLDEAVKSEAFREDLLGRLDGIRISVPPLRARREDLGLIVQELLRRHAPGRAKLKLSHRAGRALFSRRWSRNVRELERAIEAALTQAKDDVVSLEDIPAEAPPERPTAERKSKATDRTTANSAAQHERKEQLKALLTEHHGNVAAVARVMGKAREQVYRWIKASGLNPEDFRKETQG